MLLIGREYSAARRNRNPELKTRFSVIIGLQRPGSDEN